MVEEKRKEVKEGDEVKEVKEGTWRNHRGRIGDVLVWRRCCTYEREVRAGWCMLSVQDQESSR
jgi:hypothetical protein